MYEAFRSLPIGPSEAKSIPNVPNWKVCSYFSLLPWRIFISKTPETASPYSAGKAAVKKSELPNTKALNDDISPPPATEMSAKWFGFGISTPSMRHESRRGALPWIEMPLVQPSCDTPANELAKRAGSPKPPA